MCVGNDGVREPRIRIWCSTSSARSTIVTPASTRGAVAAIASSTIVHALRIRSSSAPDFTRRNSLTSGVAFTTLACGAAACISSTDSPHVRAEMPMRCDFPIDASAFRKSACPSSVSFTVTRSPGSRPHRWNATNIRGSTYSGSRPGAMKAPVTQPCA